MSEHNEQTELSPSGEARRGAMFGELIEEMDRVRVGRVRRKRAVVGVCVVGVCVVGVWLGARGIGHAQKIAGHPRGPGIPVIIDTPESAGSLVTRVTGVSSLDVSRGGGSGVRAVRISGAAGIERVGDSALLAELDRMGRPTGLIRRGGAVFLTASVAREPARPERDVDGPDV